MCSDGDCETEGDVQDDGDGQGDGVQYSGKSGVSWVKEDDTRLLLST